MRKLIGGFAMLGALSGCATVMQSPHQDLMVRTILDNREIGGVGCVLTNDSGRWFVTSPGHVTVRRSAGVLIVDCRKGVTSVGQDRFGSRPNATATFGNAVTTAGFGYYMDKQTGAGFDYPETLTVIMRSTGRVAPAEGEQQASPGAVVY